jgi:DNA-binding response OmpR family regulator
VSHALRERIEELEEENRQLRAQLIPPLTFPRRLGLTRTQSDILRFICARNCESVSRRRLYDALYGMRDNPPQEKTLDVLIYKLRGKLAPHGVSIRSKHGEGWTIAPESLAVLRAIIEGK